MNVIQIKRVGSYKKSLRLNVIQIAKGSRNFINNARNEISLIPIKAMTGI